MLLLAISLVCHSCLPRRENISLYNLVKPQSLDEHPKGSMLIYSFHKAFVGIQKSANLTGQGQLSHNSVLSIFRKARNAVTSAKIFLLPL